MKLPVANLPPFLITEFEMSMICSLVSAGKSLIPGEYEGHVETSLSDPRPGVDLVFCTESHLVEVSQGLIVRSVQLTPSSNRSSQLTSSKNKNKVKDMRIVHGQLEGEWRYVIVWTSEGRVQFLDGESLRTVKEVSDVESVAVEDYHADGSRMVVMELPFGDKLITDGVRETTISDDFDIMEVSCSEERDKTDDMISNVLSARLESISTAIAAMKAEVKTKERQLEEALNSLYLEHRLDKEVVIDGRQQTVEGDNDRQDGVQIKSHWMRLVGGKDLVLGLELLCSSDNVGDLCLQLVSAGDTSVLEYQWRLVGVSSPGSVATLHTLSSHQTATMVAIISSPCSLSVKTLLASVSYVINEHNIVTDTVKIALAQDLHFDESVMIKFDQKSSEQSLIALALTGVSKTLRITTRLGSFSNLEAALLNNDFSLNETLCSVVFSRPEHVLHQSVVKINLVSSQQCDLQLTVRDYSQATLLMRYIKRFLPLDVVFTESE